MKILKKVRDCIDNIKFKIECSDEKREQMLWDATTDILRDRGWVRNKKNDGWVFHE